MPAQPEQQQESVFKQAARELMRRGIPVIPIPPREKGCRLANWTELATTDKNQLTDWLNENPAYNAGAVALPDGFCMLDADRADLRDLINLESGRDLPRTFTVKSSKGHHYYFRQTAMTRDTGNVKKGGLFDFQQNRKYVVGPHSIHPSGVKYEVVDDSEIIPMPDWLVEWMREQVSNASEAGAKGNGEIGSIEPAMVTSMLDAYDWPYRAIKDGILDVPCPWEDEHTGEPQSGDTVITNLDGKIGFGCKHAHCYGRNIHDFRNALDPDRALYRFPMPEDEIDPEEVSDFFSIGSEETEKLDTVTDYIAGNHREFTQATEPIMQKPAADPLAFPDECLYGEAGRLARAAKMPMGLVYPAVIGCYSAKPVEDKMCGTGSTPMWR